MSSQSVRYASVLLKISGECFASSKLISSVVDQVVAARKLDVAIAVVMGGGNILRGREVADIDRAAADRAGMLATVINGIRLTELLRDRTPVRHLSARGIAGFVDGYAVEPARAAFADGRTLVLSGGTGNPFFSTDSAAALRAAELGVDALLKGTNVAGVYAADPNKVKGAKRYRRLSYEQALTERLGVMDLTAFALCMERRIPIVVFDVTRPGNIIKAIQGNQTGSLVC